MRIVRGLCGRAVGDKAAKVIGAWPIFPGERLLKLSVQLQAYSRISNDLDDAFEADFYTFAVPYSVWQTYLDDNDDLDDLGNHPTDIAGFDNRFEQIVFNMDADNSMYYGGPDPEQSTPLAPSNSETLEEELIESDDPMASVRFRGPLGIVRLGSAEMLLTPWGADGVGVGRHWARLDGSISPNLPGPMIVLLGCRRNNTDSLDDSWNMTMKNTSGRISALQRLWGGDLHRNNLLIKRGAGDVAEQMAGILFGSDTMVVGQGIWGSVQDDDSLSSGNGGVINVAAKWAASYDTPYSIYDD